MRRDDVIAELRRHEGEIRALGVEALYLFGSHARDEARPDSDVDLFIDRDPARMRSLFDLMDLCHMLEGILVAKVDVGTRTGLHPVLRGSIEREAVRVL